MSNLILNFISSNDLSPTMRVVFIAGFAILSILLFDLSIKVRNKKSLLSYGQFTALFAITVASSAICAALALHLIFFGYLF